ncbi:MULTISPECIES: DUF3613 domain-containing protein [Delftia]|jgi:cytochrome c biogenesis factor|uniref:DUF3613 domain-containing protein n=1 Tax=Delftia lacustris TaxID=558537 RepID=A0A1H3MGJ6_9BURK|nr:MULTISPECIES: DUF3613 domain-containing protein [Delftia]MXN32495.1 DUF3613 domain-containing protein [Delftia sp. CH05]SDY75289.1 Protein of unknown function [Delftia lacustris]
MQCIERKFTLDAKRLAGLCATLPLLGLMLMSPKALQAQQLVDRTVTPVQVSAVLTAESTAAAAPTSPDTAPKSMLAHLPIRQIVIGDATEQLLALQRSANGERQRTIDAAQATRSYQRYLKSFESEIPANYTTGIDTGVASTR